MNSIQTAQANYEALHEAIQDQAAIDDAMEKEIAKQKADFINELFGKRLSHQLGLDAMQSIFSGNIDVCDCAKFDEDVLEIVDDYSNSRFYTNRLSDLVKKHARHCLETDDVIFNRELAAYRKAGGDEYELLDLGATMRQRPAMTTDDKKEYQNA